MHDPTLSGFRSFELVSPPLDYGRVRDIPDATDILVANGATTDAMGALHVHVNHTSLTPANMVQLVSVVETQQAMLMRLSRTSPRQAQYFCRPWGPGFAASLRAFTPHDKASIYDAMLAHMPRESPALTYACDAPRYHLLNLQYLAVGQTIEFCQYDATQSPSRVRAFVDLSLALTVAARDTDGGNIAARKRRRRFSYAAARRPSTTRGGAAQLWFVACAHVVSVHAADRTGRTHAASGAHAG